MRSFISEITTKGTAGNHPNTSLFLKIIQGLAERRQVIHYREPPGERFSPSELHTPLLQRKATLK